MSEPVTPGVWISIGVAYALAAAVFVIRLVFGDLPLSMELPGALALAGVAAVPPTLALLGATGRPALLIPAGITAVTSLPALSVLGLAMALMGVVWFVAYAKLGPHAAPGRQALVAVIVWVLWAAAVVVLFVHLDARCVQTLTDGTVREVDAAAMGFESGWTWDVGSTISGSSITSAEVESEVCSTDVVTWLEALVSLALAGASVVTGRRLTRPTVDAPA